MLRSSSVRPGLFNKLLKWCDSGRHDHYEKRKPDTRPPHSQSYDMRDYQTPASSLGWLLHLGNGAQQLRHSWLSHHPRLLDSAGSRYTISVQHASLSISVSLSLHLSMFSQLRLFAAEPWQEHMTLMPARWHASESVKPSSYRETGLLRHWATVECNFVFKKQPPVPLGTHGWVHMGAMCSLAKLASTCFWHEQKA